MTKFIVTTNNLFRPWLDVFALSAWGILMLKYWLNGQLNLLIHPAYHWLTIAAAFGLLIIGGLKASDLIEKNLNRRGGSRQNRQPSPEHISFFPPGWSSAILLTTAIVGFLIKPTVFVSQTALQRGINDFLPVTQSQPQAFENVTRPEERSLIDWVRTLSVYPEPDAYTGQKAIVQGFVIHPPELPENYLLICRFVITCCAADAYPVGLPVKLKASREAYPPDTWLEIEGQMISREFDGQRQLTIEASAINKIPEPENPYDY